MSALFVIGQLVLGVYFVVAGLSHITKAQGMIGYATMKKIPMPAAAVYVSGLMLFLGGVGILSQKYLPISYGMLLAFLVISAFTIHNFWKETDANMRMNSMINFQKNLATAGAIAMLWVMTERAAICFVV